MKKNVSIIATYGLLEIILVGVAIVITLIHIDRLPIFIIIFGPLIILVGVFTVQSNRLAIRLNLLLSPFIVLIYTLALFTILESIFSVLGLRFSLGVGYFYFTCAILLITHIFIFASNDSRENTDTFRSNQDSAPSSR